MPKIVCERAGKGRANNRFYTTCRNLYRNGGLVFEFVGAFEKQHIPPISLAMFVDGVIAMRAGQRRRAIIIGALCLMLAAPLWTFFSTAHASHAQETGYKKYVDPRGRFSFDYPASMRRDQTAADEVKFSHPSASLRIAVFVESRQDKKPVDSQGLMESVKKNLSQVSKDAAILEQGQLPELPGAQGYLVCTFKDKNGRKVMQLVQYYVAADKMFQMIISDRPQGFLNVEKVIRHIHRSLKILKPSLD